jgi:hypothetical protein
MQAELPRSEASAADAKREIEDRMRQMSTGDECETDIEREKIHRLHEQVRQKIEDVTKGLKEIGSDVRERRRVNIQREVTAVRHATRELSERVEVMRDLFYSIDRES